MGKSLFAGLFELLEHRLDLLRLQRPTIRRRLQDYENMADNLQGLRRALETQERVIENLQQQSAAQNALVDKLREEYVALERRQAEQAEALVHAERIAVFRRLQPVVTQLPAMRAALNDGADIPAGAVLDLLSPLDQMLEDFGFERIGEVGTQVAFDPTRHRVTGQGGKQVQPGLPVRVRYVGYLRHGEVICKAEAARLE